MKDKLIELLSSCSTDPEGNRNVAVIAQHLLDNGVVVVDNDIVLSENETPTQPFCNMKVEKLVDLSPFLCNVPFKVMKLDRTL